MAATWWLTMPAAIAGPLEERAQRLFPQSRIDAVQPTPLPGLYEVRSGKSILYMHEQGRYVIIGDLYDFHARKNLTAERLVSTRAVRFEDLPLHQAIRLGPERGTHKVAVFDDPDCPFCRRFHQEVLPDLLRDSVTVYVFLYPLQQLHPDAKAKSEAIWCSQDPARSLELAFNDQDTQPTRPSASCTTPIAALQTLGATLGVTGTPTFVLENGEIVEGLTTSATLLAKLTKPHDKKGGDPQTPDRSPSSSPSR
jgi:thiol:disulfide interchange protein DsbC